MVPEDLVKRWESAYRRYGNASRASMVAGDQSAAREMAEASREVAAMWHKMETVSGLPWWALAALVAAAQALDVQARDWSARAEGAWPLDVGGPSRPRVRLATRARPDAGQHGDKSW
jgi:hypothetical protein